MLKFPYFDQIAAIIMILYSVFQSEVSSLIVKYLDFVLKLVLLAFNSSRLLYDTYIDQMLDGLQMIVSHVGLIGLQVQTTRFDVLVSIDVVIVVLLSLVKVSSELKYF